LRGAGFKGDLGGFLEAEALTLALSMAGGNPRRFIYLLSRSMYRGFARGGKRVEFQDLFEVLNEHLKLDMASKKLLYFLAKSGRAMSSNSDLQAFMGLDTVSISRRLDALTKNRLVEVVDYAEGSKVYGLPQGKPQASPSLPTNRKSSAGLEITYTLTEDGDLGGEL